MRGTVFLLSSALASLTLPGPAEAASECPDGDWFCDPAPVGSPPPSPADPDAEPGPEPETGALSDEEREERSRGPRRRIEIDVENVRPARPRRHRRFREWGVGLHVDLGLMGSDASMSRDADMNGLGGALRFRPIPHLALEGSLELVWGTDYNGFQRFEDALLLNALVFVNPRSSVQFYGLGGFGLGAAFVDVETLAGPGYQTPRDDSYSYVGAQLGFGVEGRITRHFAVGADLLGFVRRRTDRFARENPEFVDPVTHRVSNVSGGGLVRAGVTFYW